jgi:hypothetical protein
VSQQLNTQGPNLEGQARFCINSGGGQNVVFRPHPFFEVPRDPKFYPGLICWAKTWWVAVTPSSCYGLRWVAVQLNPTPETSSEAPILPHLRPSSPPLLPAGPSPPASRRQKVTWGHTCPYTPTSPCCGYSWIGYSWLGELEQGGCEAP